jgi:hypothetical protein
LATPEGDPFQAYLDFQVKWQEMMGIIGERRAEIQQKVFG